MSVMLGLGKALTVLFWWVLLVNLAMPQPAPFSLLINALGVALLALHLLEIPLFNAALRGRSHPGFDRVQILLTGIFHVMSIPQPLEPARHE